MTFGAQSRATTFSFSAQSQVPFGHKAEIEKNISTLLTAINTAGQNNTSLDLSKVDMEPNAKKRLQALWSDMHFVCPKERYISDCIQDAQGIQVRGIGVTVKPLDSSYTQSTRRELTISVNKSGVITGVRPATEMQSIIMEGATGVTDVRQRREILKWVEDFRSYYNERNVEALDQIFSDDALIITGSVVKRQHVTDGGVRIENTVKYVEHSKAEYIEKLRTILSNRVNQRINVQFDHISLQSHPAKDNVYGVTLHQKWETSRYSDDGWLFLVWDFSNPEAPKIHVRTWQPLEAVDKTGVFTLDDFFIP